MDILETASNPGSQTSAPGAGPIQRTPPRLLVGALGWLVVAVVVQVCVTFLVSFVIGFQKGFVQRAGHGHPWSVPNWFLGLVAVFAFQSALLVIAWRRGRVIGGGDAKRGLGMMRLRRRLLLVGLSLALIPIVGGWFVALRRFALVMPTNDTNLAMMLTAVRRQELGPQIATLFLVGILAPVAEEWFFRGWLWTGLRAYWRPFPVMVTTAGFWLALHLFDGPSKLLYLVPAAIMFSAARHYCDSVRASLALHLLNNLTFLGISLAALAHSA